MQLDSIWDETVFFIRLPQNCVSQRSLFNTHWTGIYGKVSESGNILVKQALRFFK